MMRFLLIALLLFSVPAFAAEYVEIDVNVSGSLVVQLPVEYAHAKITTPTTLQVRFMRPVLNSSGVQTGTRGNPFGDPAVVPGAGYPDRSDTTLTVYNDATLLWNVFNGVNVKRIHLTGTATGVKIILLKE